jgi:hypothetical protein
MDTKKIPMKDEYVRITFSRARRGLVTALVCASIEAPSAQQRPVSSAAAGTSRSIAPATVVDELVTDRPDFTESSSVVGRGMLQLESGLSYEGDADVRSLTVPSVLLRVGLSRRIELRFGGDGFLSQDSGGVRESGHSDVEIGVKIRLLDERRAGFDLSLIPMASLPTGAAAFTSGGVDPTLKVTWARSVPAGFDLSGNVNFAWMTRETSRFGQRALSASLGRDIARGWSGFVEVYSFTPIAGGEATAVTADWGVSHPIGPDMQVDVEAGRGLTAAAPDWFLGFGFAVRGLGLKR